MLSNKNGRVMVALLVLAALTVLAVAMTRPGAVLAQGPPQGGGGMMQGGGMRGMMPPMPTVAANNDFVFVVRGDTLYKFDAKTLALSGKTELPKPPMGPPPGGPGGPPPPGE